MHSVGYFKNWYGTVAEAPEWIEPVSLEPTHDFQYELKRIDWNAP